MTRGAQSKYTDKQKREAGHMQLRYERKGRGERKAVGRAWAFVDKTHGGGNRPGGSGHGKKGQQIAAKKSGTKRRSDSTISGRARPAGATLGGRRHLKKRTLKTAKNWRPK